MLNQKPVKLLELMNRWTIQVGVQERQQRHRCGEKKGHVMIKTSEELGDTGICI